MKEKSLQMFNIDLLFLQIFPVSNWKNMCKIQIMGDTVPYKPYFPMCISLEFG